jgi:hypothetical protein
MPYQHNNRDPNLNNLHHAMDYLPNGDPAVRVLSNIQGDITITGDVTIPGTVTVSSTPEDPVHTHVTEIGTSGILDVPYMPIGGTVDANVTFPDIYKISKDTNANSDSNRIFVNASGTVELGTTTLEALETITVNQGTAGASAWKVDIGNNGTVTANVTFPDIYKISKDANANSALNPIYVDTGLTIPPVFDGEIKNDSGNPIPISKNTSTNSDTNPIYVKGTSDTSFFAPTQSDAFGRLRVSNPYTIFDGGLRYGDDAFKWNQVDTGSATSSFLPNESSILMATTGAGSAIRQTKQVFSYQPGKSLLTMLTFVMDTPTAGVTQRAGYFGAENGVYFEVAGTTKNLVIRKYTSGSVDDTTEKFPQNLWNGDKLDGTGASGITLDVTKAQIFWTDIEWLGVGSVRCGFVINGQFIVCHIFHHANILDKVYMTTASLPLRYELVSTGPAATMRAICSTVISEGGYANRSETRAIGTALTGKDLSNTVYRPLVCLRLKSTAIDSIVVPTAFDVFGLQQAAFVYRIILNPTLTNADWTSAGDDSTVQYDISATALSGGRVITQGIFVGSNKGGSAQVSNNEVDFSQQLGRTIAGVSDIWCLAAIATTNNDDAVGVVNWQEHN